LHAGHGPRRRAKREIDGEVGRARLVIETTRDFNGMTITSKDVRRLDNGGKEMIVEMNTQTPHGEQKRRVVYTKS